MDVSAFASADHIQEVDKHALLTHAGYLTIKRAEGDTVYLDYPNSEVKSAMAKLYCSQFWLDRLKSDSLAKAFLESVEAQDAESVRAVLNAVVHPFDYSDFPLKSEGAVRHLIQVFCLGAGIPTRIEVHSPKGRSDLEISTSTVDAVFEFKFARARSEVAGLLKSASKQIADRDYGSALPHRSLLRLALVFSEPDRSFAAAFRV